MKIRLIFKKISQCQVTHDKWEDTSVFKTHDINVSEEIEKELISLNPIGFEIIQ